MTNRFLAVITLIAVAIGVGGCGSSSSRKRGNDGPVKMRAAQTGSYIPRPVSANADRAKDRQERREAKQRAKAKKRENAAADPDYVPRRGFR